MRRPRPTAPRLALTPLEARDVPAGNVTAVVSNGLLTLTGDAAANAFTLEKFDDDTHFVHPDATTQVNGGPAGGFVQVEGFVRDVRAALGDGNDTFAIEGTQSFVLSGKATIDLGAGSNTLTLRTTGRLDLGALAVTTASGAQAVVVRGGAGTGSRVQGSATFNYPFSTSVTEFTDVAFPGSGGVSLAGDGVSTEVAVNNATVAGTLRAASGPGTLTLGVTGGFLGALSTGGVAESISLTNATVAGTLRATEGTFLSLGVTGGVLGGLATGGLFVTVSLTNATVFGSAALNGAMGGPTLTATGSTVTGTLSLAGPAADSVPTATFTGANRLGGLKVKGSLAIVRLAGAASALAVVGDVSMSGREVILLDAAAGTFAARHVTLKTFGPSPSSGQYAVFEAGGSAVTVNGNLTVAATSGTRVRFATTGASEVLGKTVVTGGKFDDSFEASSTFRSGGGLTLNLGSGDDTVVLGDNTARTSIDGGLSLNLGGGVNSVTQRRVTVGGATAVRGGTGVDTLLIERGSSFVREAKFDLGAGNDVFRMAQETGSDRPVTFYGKATMALGDGDDELSLGRSMAAGGDANTVVVFYGPQIFSGTEV